MGGGNEQLDGPSRKAGGHHQFVKKTKNRKERRKARINPETTPTYKKYNGWEL